MAAAGHRIGRLVFEIGAADRADVSRFAEMVRGHFEGLVVPALQEALDRIDGAGSLTRLSRIEIDLGVLGAAAFVPGELARRITEGLAESLPVAAAPHQSRADEAHDDAGELIVFLEAGELPWPEPGGALASLGDALMALDTAGISRLAARLRGVLVRRRAAERLVRQLPAALVRRLVIALLPDTSATLLAAALGPGTTSTAPAPDQLATALADVLRELAVGTGAPDFGRVAVLLTALDGGAGALPVGVKLPPAAVPERPRQPLETRSEATPRRRAAPEPDVAHSSARPVHAAGAVLLHPFLGAFFDRLGLLAAPSRFRDPSAQARAVLLSHHLATGAEEAPEPETTVFKLLCGLALEEPVPRRLHLGEAERAEAEALLASVISHWHRLGRTSPAGLREGFLTRPGRLSFRYGLWHLAVESRGIDVLLDALPWSLSRVRTPFMTSVLAVDWR